MAEIVNLRRARKAKARADEARQAEANRAKFGTPKAERDLEKNRKNLADKRLSGHGLNSESAPLKPNERD